MTERKRSEIYTYESQSLVYSMNWSVSTRCPAGLRCPAVSPVDITSLGCLQCVWHLVAPSPSLLSLDSQSWKRRRCSCHLPCLWVLGRSVCDGVLTSLAT